METNSMTTTLDSVINEAAAAGLCVAATLLRFAADVLNVDAEKRSTWVALRAIDDAESSLRGAVDQGDDLNTVDARLSALRLRLGISGIRDVIQAGGMVDWAIADGAVDGSESRASRILEAAAKTCYRLAWQAEDAS
jgi:hypothetical protein